LTGAARRVLIDTDPGLDDLLALAFAAGSPELRIAALTTVAGNAPLDAVCENAARFCALAQLDVPLGRGAALPLALAPGDATYFHGTDGRRGLELPAPRPAAAGPAQEILERLLRGGELDCVVALGPLTNLAPLVRQRPDWFRGVPVIWMGGGLAHGNVTAAAEFNCWADPHAASWVLGSGIDLTVIGLDVTESVTLREHELEGRPFGSGRRARFLEGALAMLIDAEQRGSGRRCAVLHDPAAIAAALDDELFRCERRCFGVTVCEGPERGRLSDLPRAGARGVRWATEVDRGRLVERFLRSLRAWAQAEEARA
jgi:inosine/uridine nucleosidase